MSKQTTPPYTMQRRAFLTGLGLSGLGGYPPAHARRLHTHTSFPDTATVSQTLQSLSEATRQQIREFVTLAPHLPQNERIARISAAMKGTPYIAQPLIGSATVPEELVLAWKGVNCMTFIEIVTALSMSHNEADFIQALIATRYLNHHVRFAERRHFLSDWLYGSPVLCHDKTRHIPYARHVLKTLNLKLPSSPSPTAGQDYYLPGLPLKKRLISYLPTQPFVKDLHTGGYRHKIHTGDVIGIYSPLPGLDVFHVGFAIWHNDILLFRNASSLPIHRYVVDVPLDAYLHERRGIVVYGLQKHLPLQIK